MVRETSWVWGAGNSLKDSQQESDRSDLGQVGSMAVQMWERGRCG
jgi:hypothetical protein